jgi:NAD(P)-dependent dehydrogenase (short-subunit alcohol dehydrogenase family)
MQLPESLPTRAFALALLLVFLSLLWRRRCRACVNAHGRVVVISGCDSGLGHLLAMQLFQRGFSVFAGCLTPDGAQLLQSFAATQKHPHRAFLQPLLLDITDDTSIARAVQVKHEAFA